MGKKADITVEYKRLEKRLKNAEAVLKKSMPELLKLIGCWFVQSATLKTPMSKMKSRKIIEVNQKNGGKYWKIPYRFCTPRKVLGLKGVTWFFKKSEANKSPLRKIEFRGLGKLGWQYSTRTEKEPAALPNGIPQMAQSYASRVSEKKFTNNIWSSPKLKFINKSLTIKGLMEATNAVTYAIGRASNRLNAILKIEKQKIIDGYNKA